MQNPARQNDIETLTSTQSITGPDSSMVTEQEDLDVGRRSQSWRCENPQSKWCDRKADHGEAQGRQESTVTVIGSWYPRQACVPNVDINRDQGGQESIEHLRPITVRLLADKSPQFKKISGKHLAYQEHHRLITVGLLAGRSSRGSWHVRVPGRKDRDEPISRVENIFGNKFAASQFGLDFIRYRTFFEKIFPASLYRLDFIGKAGLHRYFEIFLISNKSWTLQVDNAFERDPPLKLGRISHRSKVERSCSERIGNPMEEWIPDTTEKHSSWLYFGEAFVSLKCGLGLQGSNANLISQPNVYQSSLPKRLQSG
ncbi:uncharacterized protein G2W53_010519 [Senna tora]|uniref:Uncharacterized protein n=1 Tax=Senna tora TaxID=362788 RepID=A0A834X0W3_9FABA|nr:uncharacterized protein G2W53_010519 [Senna tora]